jgi:Dolichyl-phosphate-mannose-protein mannosyltransferase
LRTSFDRYDAGALLACAIYLYFNLFDLKGTPFLLGGDEQTFWMNAQRLLHGELIYRDFFEFTPPGTDLVYLGAFELLGSRIWVPNIVQLVLGTTLCWLCFRIARLIMTPAKAALAAALVMVVDFCTWLDATHHWFSLLAVMAAVAVAMKATSPGRILVCGALLGLASFFTQTRGIFAALGFAGFLLWEGFQAKASWRTQCARQLQLVVSFVLAWGLLSSYFIAKVGIAELFYFQVTHVLRYVTNEAINIIPDEHHPLRWSIHAMLVYFAIPIVYAISLWRCREASVDVRRIVILAFAGIGMFLEVAQSPNQIRVHSVALPAIILSVWLVGGLAERLREHARMLECAIIALWVGLIFLGTHRVWKRNAVRAVVMGLPGGTTAATALQREELTWIARHTTAGDFFFQASYQSLFLPLDLRNPAFDFLDRYTSPEFVELDIRQLEAKRVHYILWSPRDRPRYPRFEQFLADRYHQVWEFSNQDEIWELK